MPRKTVGLNWFKNILGTGIKSNIFLVKIPFLHKVILSIKESQKKYSAQEIIASGMNPASAKPSISEVNALASFPSIISGEILGLCRTCNYPSEGYDVTANSYWNRKTAGKINTSPLSLSFMVDGEYKNYNTLSYIRDGITVDRQHGVFNYPETYMIENIIVASFNPSVYTNIQGLTAPNVPIYIKNYKNCWITEVLEIVKDKSQKDALEEFIVNIEYESCDTGENDIYNLNMADIMIAKSLYVARKTYGNIKKVQKKIKLRKK